MELQPPSGLVRLDEQSFFWALLKYFWGKNGSAPNPFPGKTLAHKPKFVFEIIITFFSVWNSRKRKNRIRNNNEINIKYRDY